MNFKNTNTYVHHIICFLEFIQFIILDYILHSKMPAPT